MEGNTYANTFLKARLDNKKFPIPGIEPGPPGWEPGILTTRPYRIDGGKLKIHFIYLTLVWVLSMVVKIY